MISIIKKLTSITRKLVLRERAKAVRKLNMEAERIDNAFEIAGQRMTIAENIYASLQERAENKLQQDVANCNKRKAELASKLDELNSL